MEHVTPTIAIVPSRPSLTATVVGRCDVCDGARHIQHNDAAESHSFRPCPCCAALYERVSLYDAAGIPARFAGATFDSLEPMRVTNPKHRQMLIEATHRCRDFATNAESDWLVLAGPTGTAKTHLLASIAYRACLEIGVAVKYVNMTDVFTTLKSAGSDTAAFRDLNAAVSTVPVLLLDEVGSGRTEFEQGVTSRLICRRYDVDLPMVVATNFMPREAPPELALASRLFETAASRIDGAQWLPVLGEDQRRSSRGR